MIMVIAVSKEIKRACNTVGNFIRILYTAPRY